MLDFLKFSLVKTGTIDLTLTKEIQQILFASQKLLEVTEGSAGGIT